jgi:hypothetical protein
MNEAQADDGGAEAKPTMPPVSGLFQTGLYR